MKPVINSILGDNDVYSSKYIEETINLVKSILLTNSKEAKLYNDLVERNYGIVDRNSDKSEWRYYLHLSGRLHRCDPTVMVTSIDNGQPIEISIDSFSSNRKTLQEMLKFGSFYDEVIQKYPEQELYVKACCVLTDKLDLNRLTSLEDFTIIGYNRSLVEANELDLMDVLQISIDNYKVHKLISHYALTETLFIASQYHILYNYLVTEVLAIRLRNVKTYKVHSYHLKNYLSSNYEIDEQFRSLTKSQALFLYRNLKYLSVHPGAEKSFKLLIEKLFTDRNISFTNIKQRQVNALNTDKSVTYKLYLDLLNSKELVYDTSEYDINYIKNKELYLAKGNEKEYEFNTSKIDEQLRYSLHGSLKTKDMYTFITEVTDSVKYKLMDTLVDYWAYCLSQDQLNFVMYVQDPVTNNRLALHTRDMFKLFVVALYASNGIDLTDTSNGVRQFPTYRSVRVFKPQLPPKQELLDKFYNKRQEDFAKVNNLYNNIPAYRHCASTFDFYNFIIDIYKYNLGSWLYLSNMHDIDENGQLAGLLENCTQLVDYEFRQETVTDFVNRVGVQDIGGYQKSVLDKLVYDILDGVFDNRLSGFFGLRQIQKDLVSVFKKFNSYTIQIIEDVSSEDCIVTNLIDQRYLIEGSNVSTVRINLPNDRYDYQASTKHYHTYKEPLVMSVTYVTTVSINKDPRDFVNIGDPINIELRSNSYMSTAANLGYYRVDFTANYTYNNTVIFPYRIIVESYVENFSHTLILSDKIEPVTTTDSTYNYVNSFNLINDLDANEWVTELPSTDDNLFIALNL